MILKILVKKVYGNIRYYPLCEKSELLLALIKQNCFTKENMKIIKDLGYEITFQGEGMDI